MKHQEIIELVFNLLYSKYKEGPLSTSSIQNGINNKASIHEIESILLTLEDHGYVRSENAVIEGFQEVDYLLYTLTTKGILLIENPKPKVIEERKVEKYKLTIWFNVGLLFANGEMDKLIIQFKSNANQIAKSLNNPSYRPYISESISKANKNDKNIFSNQGKLRKIQAHCKENNISIVEDFLRLIQPN